MTNLALSHDITEDPRNRFHNLADAQKCADKQVARTGRPWLVCEAVNVSPKFSVVPVPAVGDKVSYGFNGDYYPDGEIVRVSKGNLTVTTSGGHRYYRRGNTASWIQAGGTWSLVPGHINERNPSF